MIELSLKMMKLWNQLSSICGNLSNWWTEPGWILRILKMYLPIYRIYDVPEDNFRSTYHISHSCVFWYRCVTYARLLLVMSDVYIKLILRIKVRRSYLTESTSHRKYSLSLNNVFDRYVHIIYPPEIESKGACSASYLDIDFRFHNAGKRKTKLFDKVL